MPDDYIAELESRRADLDRQFRGLVREMEYLDAIIRKRKVEIFNAGRNLRATRKNERQIFVWGLIRQMLIDEHAKKKGKGKGLKTREIYDQLIKDQEYVKYPTLRSYLHRLNRTGRISQTQRSGMWRWTEMRDQKEKQDIWSEL